MEFKFALFLVCLYFPRHTDCARILGTFIFPSYSHQSVYQGIWKELSNRGHELVIITTNPVQDPSLTNVKQIDISFMYDIWKEKYDMKKSDAIALGKMIMANHFKQIGILSEDIYKHPEIQTLLKNSSETFDLLMVDFLYPSMIALSIKFKCPFVGISSLDPIDPLQMDIGNYFNPAIYPSFFCSFLDKLSFIERLKSVELSVWMRIFYDTEIYPRCDRLVKQYVGEDYPSVKDIAANISMMFANSNPLFAVPRPNIPTVIEFSGLHIKKPKPLPQHIQDYLDKAPEGVIYFSLGSNIKSHLVSPALKLTFLETFKELPYKILWKFEESNFTNLPNNVKIEKWLPQQDILLHPNVKVFITQGGLQSLEEAIRKRVPLLGMPFLIDQPRNMNKMKTLGLGQVVDKETLTKTLFKEAIIEVAENSKYRQRVEELANLLEDQMVNPLDKIIWWMEYVIRHGGTAHLRSPFLDIPTYKYFMWDIFAFCICCLLIFIFVLYRAVKLFFKFMIQITKPKLE